MVYAAAGEAMFHVYFLSLLETVDKIASIHADIHT